VINIAGLAVGIAVCLVIFLVIQFELSFDNYHSKKDRIYRVLTELHSADGVGYSGGVPFPLPNTLHKEYPNITSSGIFHPGNDQILVLGEQGQTLKKFREERGLYFAEPSLFEILDFNIIEGDYKALKDPNTAFLSQSTAERYFGSWQAAIGKTIKRNDDQIFKIVGVIKDVPVNSDLRIDVLCSYKTVKRFQENTDWVSVASSHQAYVLLPEKMTKAAFNAQLKQFTKKYKATDQQDNIQLIQSISEIHYDSEVGNNIGRTISKQLINTLWLIAAFILLIACVNFINLSTAQAINRAKEVAVRKVLGGNKWQLKLQFFNETALITLMAILLSALIAYLSIPALSKMLDLSLSMDVLKNPLILAFLGAIAILIILLAGFYPAMVLAGYKPATALKSKLKAGKAKGISLRRGLVVFQFIIAQGLIIGTLIIVKQMDYFRNRPMGFDKESIVILSFLNDSSGLSKTNYLKDQLMQMKGVKSVSFSFASPADNGGWYSNFRYDHQKDEVDWSASMKWADDQYLTTYNIPLVAGRNVKASDTVREFLVNETLLTKLGVKKPEDALNKEMEMWGGQMRGQIVGVVKDFNANSLREAMVPVIITTRKEFYYTANIKMQTEGLSSTMSGITTLWNKVFPDYVPEQSFMDARIENFYIQEQRLSNLYKIFAGIAIFLSCLGLYGLASFMAAQKIKEVGIRKVLGASVNSIIMLFSKEFLVLIAVAFLIAAPLAWYFMHGWLQDFVYRISIPWWILVLAGILAALIALITVSFQAIKAALANPVKSLRSE
jgi:putative ABC transport system permease protein